MPNMEQKYKYLTYIVGFYITFQTANLIIPGKLVGFWEIAVPASVFFFPFTYIFADIITEVYGYKEARKAVWQVFFTMILGALIFFITAHLPPADGFKYNDAFTKVLGFAPRVVISSIIATWIGAIANDYLMAKLKVWSKGSRLWIRTISSTVVGEGLNTAVFYTLAFVGIFSASMLVKVIFWGWIIKTAVEIIMTPITYAVIRKLKKAEGVDHYDTHTDFNPFKLT
jgi:queuosine precursor transporter